MSSLFILLCAAGLTSSVPFYRYDYTYVEEFEAFYKLHMDYNRNFSSAFTVCEEEEAELFYPTSPEEHTVVKTLVEDFSHPLLTSEIFVGTRVEFEDCDFCIMKVNSASTPKWSFETSGKGRCVTMSVRGGTLAAHECSEKDDIDWPFVCKKIVNQAECPTVGYKYSEETGKCYKIHTHHENWCKAMKTCLLEGATLLTAESKDEVDFFKKEVPYYLSHYIGVKRRLSDRKFYTITGHKLKVDGFKNRLYVNKQNNCGKFYKYLNNIFELHSTLCETKLPFICEIKVSG